MQLYSRKVLLAINTITSGTSSSINIWSLSTSISTKVQQEWRLETSEATNTSQYESVRMPVLPIRRSSLRAHYAEKNYCRKFHVTETVTKMFQRTFSTATLPLCVLDSSLLQL